MSKNRKDTRRRSGGRTRIPTPESLAAAAVRYLSRYATSEANLRRVLKNSIRRAAAADGGFARDREAQRKLLNVIDSLIEKHRKSGALDDSAYAAAKADSLRRTGHSAKIIALRLKRDGIADSIISSVLSQEKTIAGKAELSAALAFAKRKKIGLFRLSRPQEEKATERSLLLRREFAAMERAGFSYDTAREILGGETEIGTDD